MSLFSIKKKMESSYLDHYNLTQNTKTVPKQRITQHLTRIFTSVSKTGDLRSGLLLGTLYIFVGLPLRVLFQLKPLNLDD